MKIERNRFSDIRNVDVNVGGTKNKTVKSLYILRYIVLRSMNIHSLFPLYLRNMPSLQV